MPVRKVRNHGNNIIGKFPSRKMERMISFESTIERDYLFILDYESNVTSIEEQPLTIEYRHEGKVRHYTPDFHFLRNGQRILTDCKPATLVNDPENKIKFSAAYEFCQEYAWQFEVVTDTDLRSGFRLQNIKLLTRHASYNVRPEIKAQIFALLLSWTSPRTIREFQQIIRSDPSQPDISIQTCLLQMAFHHEIALSLEHAPISVQSLVYLPSTLPTI